ncbi:hypothetical protein O6P43_005582 [Quillaja saponaria]|uniref:Uncharacterized protein n=1 Tax=Quillaja saponaria TaxID=32244 RepID=A0AAD7VH73_QUISA|nr:hypothetical protein O6P43_005582 [Quillaja saponaria]
MKAILIVACLFLASILFLSPSSFAQVGTRYGRVVDPGHKVKGPVPVYCGRYNRNCYRGPRLAPPPCNTYTRNC